MATARSPYVGHLGILRHREPGTPRNVGRLWTLENAEDPVPWGQMLARLLSPLLLFLSLDGGPVAASRCEIHGCVPSATPANSIHRQVFDIQFVPISDENVVFPDFKDVA